MKKNRCALIILACTMSACSVNDDCGRDKLIQSTLSKFEEDSLERDEVSGAGKWYFVYKGVNKDVMARVGILGTGSTLSGAEVPDFLYNRPPFPARQGYAGMFWITPEDTVDFQIKFPQMADPLQNLLFKRFSEQYEKLMVAHGETWSVRKDELVIAGTAEMNEWSRACRAGASKSYVPDAAPPPGRTLPTGTGATGGGVIPPGTDPGTPPPGDHL